MYKKVKYSSSDLLAVAWSCAPLSYILSNTAMISQIALLSMTALFATLAKKTKIHIDSFIFIAIVTLLASTSMIIEIRTTPSIEAYIALATFVALFLLTSLVISPQDFKRFCDIFFTATSLIALLHLAMAMVGAIDSGYGRYSFFGGSHPNLGGEIYLTAAMLGSLGTLQFRKYLILSVPMFASAFLMESRTALVTMFFSVTFRYLVDLGTHKNMVKTALKLLAIFSITFGVFISSPFMQDFVVNKVMQMSNPYRGVDTGLVTGRDLQWLQAWNYFVNAPFFGNGISFYKTQDVRGAHNAVLYSLSQFGLLGLLIWAWVLYAYIKILRNSRRSFILLVPTFIPFLLNDRFINLNAYPFLYYFALAQLTNMPASGKKEKTIEKPDHQSIASSQQLVRPN